MNMRPDSPATAITLGEAEAILICAAILIICASAGQ